MSDTNVQAEPVTTKRAKTKAEVKREAITLEINTVPLDAIETQITKGPNHGNPLIILDLPLEDSDKWDALKRAVGTENFYRTIFGVVREICLDASGEALAEDKTIDGAKYAAEFEQGWLPTTRRAGGPSLKELNESRSKLQDEMTPFIKKLMAGEISPEEKMTLNRLCIEAEELSLKIESKHRKGKAPAAVTAQPV